MKDPAPLESEINSDVDFLCLNVGYNFVPAGLEFAPFARQSNIAIHPACSVYAHLQRNMQAILKFKKIIVLKSSIKFTFRLHNHISFEKIFKITPHLYIFSQ